MSGGLKGSTILPSPPPGQSGTLGLQPEVLVASLGSNRGQLQRSPFTWKTNRVHVRGEPPMWKGVEGHVLRAETLALLRVAQMRWGFASFYCWVEELSHSVQMSVDIPYNYIKHHIHPSFHLISVLFYTVLFIYVVSLSVLAMSLMKRQILSQGPNPTKIEIKIKCIHRQ